MPRSPAPCCRTAPPRAPRVCSAADQQSKASTLACANRGPARSLCFSTDSQFCPCLLPGAAAGSWMAPESRDPAEQPRAQRSPCASTLLIKETALRTKAGASPSRPWHRALCPVVLSEGVSRRRWQRRGCTESEVWQRWGRCARVRPSPRWHLWCSLACLYFFPGKKLFVNSSLTAPLVTENHVKAGQFGVPD